VSRAKSVSMFAAVLVMGITACSSSAAKKPAATTTTLSRVGVSTTLGLGAGTSVGAGTTVPLAGGSTVPGDTTASASSTPAASTTSTTVATSNGKDFEVVVGTSYKAQTDAQAVIDKLTKAGFTKFVAKKLSASYAVVYAGLSQQQASVLAQRINDKKLAGITKATIFHITGSTGGTTTATTTASGKTTTTVAGSKTTYTVTVGPYTSKSAAQAALTKLVAAKVTGFAITGSGTTYNLVHSGLNKTDATTIQKKITSGNLGTAKVTQSK
jgi:SPOR domain